MQHICLGGESAAAAVAAVAAKAKTRKVCSRSDLARGAGAGAGAAAGALHRCAASKARERRGNLTDFVGDGRFFFPIISSKAGITTLRFNNIFVFKLRALDYPR